MSERMKYDYWFVFLYLRDTNYDMGNGGFSLDHEVTLDDLDSLAEWLKQEKGFDDVPVILNYKLLKKGPFEE